MARPLPDRRLTLAQPDADLSPAEARLEWLGAAVAVVWIGLVLVWGLGLADLQGTRGFLFLAFAILLPVAMLGLVILLLRQVRGLRREAQALARQVQAQRVVEAREAAARVVEAERAIRAPVAPAPAAPPPIPSPAQPAVAEDQPALGLAAEADPPPLAVEDFIRALQFPESADDTEGFAALRRALADHGAAKLVRAAQDVLTLLARDGIYMDDLVPDRARPELWRRFAQGARGRQIAALGGIRDRSCLALTGQKMREDPVFRDAAHHFLRSFDRGVSAIEPRCDDAALNALAETRTARAFMLIGRVAGTFD